MSDKYFFNKFSTSITTILELIQMEQFPGEVQGGKTVSSNWSCKDFLNFFVSLYIRYARILKDVEDAYDQIIHPQLRKYILKFLENILCRLVQIKKEIIFYNNPIIKLPAIIYVFLDDYIIDMKIEPRDLDLIIPRYFREDISPIAKRKKQIIKQRLIEKNGDDLPEAHIFRKPFSFSLSVHYIDAVKMLQSFELGRQNLRRITKIKADKTKKLDKFDEGQVIEGDATKILIEVLISKYKLKRNRNDEMKFLKMIPEDECDLEDPDAEKENYIKLSKLNRAERKQTQEQNLLYYNQYKKNLVDKIELIEGKDMEENMITERREWINKYKAENKEPPWQVDMFYKRNEVEKKEELDENQKKVKENIAKDKLKKEQDKKKKEESGAFIQLPIYSGGSEQVQNLGNNIDEFNKLFNTPSDYLNQREFISDEIASSEIFNGIEKKIENKVDDFIQMEITNLRKIHLKGKRDPKIPRRPPKVVGPVEKLGKGEKKLSKIPHEELLSDVIFKKIFKKKIPKYLDDLICDFNYIANSMQLVDEKMIDVPLWYTKQLIKEISIYPLGCPLVRKNSKILTNSILFHGPTGSGKTHAALAIAYHSDAMIFDVSPSNLERFSTKEDVVTMIASAFRAARIFQPAIFYFNEAEQIFPGKLPRGMKKNPSATRLKKIFLDFKGIITPDMRVQFIGCTNKGWLMNTADMKKMFDKTLYFGYPSFSDRHKLWKHEICKKLGNEVNLSFDVLAQMSNNFSAQSIIQTVRYVLTRLRVERSKFDPVSEHEFISYLSKANFLFKDEFIANRDFLFKASGLDVIHNYLNDRREEAETGKRKKK